MSWLSKNFKKIVKAVLIIVAVVLIAYAISAIFLAMALASAGGGAAGGAGGVGGAAGAAGGTTGAGGATLGASGTTAAGEAVAHIATFTAPTAPAVASGETLFLVGSGVGSGTAGAIIINSQAKQSISDRKMPEVKIDVPTNWPDPNYTYGASAGQGAPPFWLSGGAFGELGGGNSGATVPAMSMPMPPSSRPFDVNPGYSLTKKLPTNGERPFVPKKQKGGKLKVDREGGYIDKNGNSWRWDPRKQEWDVQHRGGSHTNVNTDGNITHGPDNF